MDNENLRGLFSKNGLIGKALPNYEERLEQIEMASRIQQLIEADDSVRRILIVEAGTGVGKSLAYLVPFVYYAVNEKKKVVISTYTKTLQEQLTNKDLPLLESILPLGFKYVLCVGSENYVCLRRFKQAFQYNLFETREQGRQFEAVSKWLQKTSSGIRLELDFEPDDRLWGNICRESDLCVGKKCLNYGRCFYMGARLRQNEADILVVNHHLFFSNIASGGKILPAYGAVVFDEAHNVEDVACQYLGIEISNTGINYILSRLYNPFTGRGLLDRVNSLSEDLKREVIASITDLRNTAGAFFESVVDKFGSAAVTKRIYTPGFFENNLDLPLTALYKNLKKCMQEAETEEQEHEFNAYANRCLAVQAGLKTFIGQKQENDVYWIEITPRLKNVRVVLNVTPINVSEILRERVYEFTPKIIFTSATLATYRTFDYIKERLGLTDTDKTGRFEISGEILDSPFDYRNNVVLYFPGSMPDPSYEYDKFQLIAVEHIKDIVEIFRGRTFVLFTSYETLNKADDFLGKNLLGITVLKQGEMPRWQMIESFKSNANSLLLGTSTFWQGVDIPGKALECVIIFKLPFAVPDDPTTEARIEYIIKQKKDPFIHYQLPQAIIMLKQGFGRLIRTKSDRGAVAILDPRIKTRYYGKMFMESLPECLVTDDINVLRRFESPLK